MHSHSATLYLGHETFTLITLLATPLSSAAWMAMEPVLTGVGKPFEFAC